MAQTDATATTAAAVTANEDAENEDLQLLTTTTAITADPGLPPADTGTNRCDERGETLSRRVSFHTDATRRG
jgi:hypothetical protein